MDFIARLEEQARAENPELSNTQYARSRSSSPAAAAPLVPLPAPREVAPVASSSLTTLDLVPPTPEATETPIEPVAAIQETSNADQSETAPPVKQVKKRPLPKSPPPKKPPKPQPTIRLELNLKAAIDALPRHGVYEVNFEEQARETGLRVIQSESEKGDSTSEGSDDEEDAEDAKPAPFSAGTTAVLGQAPEKKKSKRVRPIEDRDEGYDTEDSFVDDSELHYDMPKFYKRPARDGFFVSNGILGLYEVPAAKGRKKPKSSNAAHEEPPKKRAKKVPLTNGVKAAARSRSVSKQNEEEEGPKQLPKNAVAWAAAGDSPEKKPKIDEPRPDVKNFPAEMKQMAEKLIALIKSTSFVPKNKFPQDLKPPLHEFALLAVKCQQYDDHFFRYLATIFPYNRFTMEKLTKREIYPMRIEAINEQQEKLISELESRIPAQMEPSEAHYAKEMEAYSSRLAKWQEEQTVKDSDGMVVDAAADAKTPVSKSRKDKQPAEPAKKTIFTEEMRRILWEISVLDDEVVNLTKEKAALEKNDDEVPKEKVARKNLYSRLLKLFPEDWMTTTLISRQWSQAKQKYGGTGADDEDM